MAANGVGNGGPPMHFYSAPAGFNTLAAPPTYELIPHRVFVGGFPPVTTEQELRLHFEQFYHIREVKIIRDPNGVSKCYGFVTFDTEEEAEAVRAMSPERLEFKGRRLNLGPALRRMVPRYSTEYAMATPAGQLVPSPTLAYTYSYPPQPASPAAAAPSLVMMSPAPVANSSQHFFLSPSESTETAVPSPNTSLGSVYSPAPYFMPASPMTPRLGCLGGRSPLLPPLLSPPPTAFYHHEPFPAYHMGMPSFYYGAHESAMPPLTPLFSSFPHDGGYSYGRPFHSSPQTSPEQQCEVTEVLDGGDAPTEQETHPDPNLSLSSKFNELRINGDSGDYGETAKAPLLKQEM